MEARLLPRETLGPVAQGSDRTAQKGREQENLPIFRGTN